MRYWDGIRWTDQVSPPAPPTIEQPPLPDGTRLGTVWVWVMAVLPLLDAVLLLSMNLPGLITQAAAQQMRDMSSERMNVLIEPTSPGLLALEGVGFLLRIALVVLAFLDQRALTRLGVVKPFFWAWSLFELVGAGGWVYLIGRTVVLKRRTGRGSAPLWVFIGSFVVTTAVVIAVVTASVAAVVGQINTLDLPTT